MIRVSLDAPVRGLKAVQRIVPGDLIAKATTMVGIKPCGGCKQRQQKLNNWWLDLTDKLTNAMK